MLRSITPSPRWRYACVCEAYQLSQSKCRVNFYYYMNPNSSEIEKWNISTVPYTFTLRPLYIAMQIISFSSNLENLQHFSGLWVMKHTYACLWSGQTSTLLIDRHILLFYYINLAVAQEVTKQKIKITSQISNTVRNYTNHCTKLSVAKYAVIAYLCLILVSKQVEPAWYHNNTKSI